MEYFSFSGKRPILNRNSVSDHLCKDLLELSLGKRLFSGRDCDSIKKEIKSRGRAGAMTEDKTAEELALLIEAEIADALSGEREAELERQLYLDEHPQEETAKRRLRREVEREALARLEESAKTLEDFKEIRKRWNKRDANEERRIRYHEINRGDVPMEYEMADDGSVFPAFLNNSYWRPLHKGNLLDIIFDCPHEIDEQISYPRVSALLKKLKAEHKELLYYLSIRRYSASEFAKVVGQSDRNVRKKRMRLIRRIQDDLYELLKQLQAKGYPITKREQRFMEAYKSGILETGPNQETE